MQCDKQHLRKEQIEKERRSKETKPRTLATWTYYFTRQMWGEPVQKESRLAVNLSVPFVL